MTDRPPACEVCGLDWSSVNPADAVVAIRSYPRRYRRAFGAFADDDDADALLRRRPDPATWSALEYAAHVRGGLELSRQRIERALSHPGERVGSVPLKDDPWIGHDRSDSPEAVLDGIEAAAERLVATAADVPDDGWDRWVVVDDDRHPHVLRLLQLAVHEGSHHLRDVEDVIRRVRAEAT